MQTYASFLMQISCIFKDLTKLIYSTKYLGWQLMAHVVAHWTLFRLKVFFAHKTIYSSVGYLATHSSLPKPMTSCRTNVKGCKGPLAVKKRARNSFSQTKWGKIILKPSKFVNELHTLVCIAHGNWDHLNKSSLCSHSVLLLPALFTILVRWHFVCITESNFTFSQYYFILFSSN